MAFQLPISATELAQRFDIIEEIVGDPNVQIRELAPIAQLGAGKLSFCTRSKFKPHLQGATDAVVLISAELLGDAFDGPTFLVTEHPQWVFSQLSYELSARDFSSGISDLASIHPSVELGEGVCIAPNVVIEAGARIGSFSRIGPNTVVGEKCSVGEYCDIRPNVTIHHHVSLGNRVKIGASSVIGSEGFGLVSDPSTGFLREQAHIGKVVLEDDVRLGACCTVDRATCGQTRIGARTKCDDHVHVGHNCQIGTDCVLCAFVALGGSATLGNQVVLGGQCGVADHVTIGDQAKLGAKTGVSVNLKGGQDYWLTPAVPLEEGVRVVRNIRRLPRIWEKLRKLEQDIGN